MSADLERDLLEAGDGLGDVVAALRRAPQARVPEGFAARVMSRLPRKGGFVRAKWLSPSVLLAVAASLVAAFVFVSLAFRPAPQDPSAPSLSACQRGDGSFSSSSAAPYVQAFAVAALAKDPSLDRVALDLAVDTLVRTQDAAGGWGNAALSARNVAALAQAESAGVAQARAARRRGLRYLRMHGVGEISAGELVREAKDAFARIGQSHDDGLVCSTALAGRL
jgi:hypothetical protein